MRAVIQGLVLLVMLLTCATPAHAAARVKVGQTVKIALPRQPRIVGIEDTTIARLVKVTPDGFVLVRGLKPGATRIIGRDFAEVPIIIPLVVTRR